jgi:hypothetical protein
VRKGAGNIPISRDGDRLVLLGQGEIWGEVATHGYQLALAELDFFKYKSRYV